MFGHTIDRCYIANPQLKTNTENATTRNVPNTNSNNHKKMERMQAEIEPKNQKSMQPNVVSVYETENGYDIVENT